MKNDQTTSSGCASTVSEALRFELINPSDPYTFTAPDLETAALAVVLLGRGQYGGKSLDGGEDVPIFLFGGHDEWFAEKFGRTPKESLDHIEHEAIAACLDTLTLGRAERSSMNNIGKGATLLAAALRDATEAA
jgi:hypothetical protein